MLLLSILFTTYAVVSLVVLRKLITNHRFDYQALTETYQSALALAHQKQEEIKKYQKLVEILSEDFSEEEGGDYHA